MQNILIRADSSSKIGTGHIMRDLVLAEQFKDAAVIFATQNLLGNINHKIEEKKYPIILLESNKIEELLTLIKLYSIDMVIIDHYKIDFGYEKELKEKTGVKIFVLDDTYEKHHCDILLNHNICGDKNRYHSLVPPHCELRCGTDYTLLRDEFIQEKKKRKKGFKTKNSLLEILIAMGGADHSNINIKILKVLKKFKNIKVNIVTTSANKNLEKLNRYCKNKKWIHLHINSNKIAKLMSNSDFAIVTPSVTVNEAYFMELPFIAIKTADNQKHMYKYLRQNGFLTLNKYSKKKLTYQIKKEFFNVNKRNKRA